jgi:glycogen synthase
MPFQPVKPTAVVLSLSHIASDGRVCRQISALETSGHNVLAIGLTRPGESVASDRTRSGLHLSVSPWSTARRIGAAGLLLAARPLMTLRCALAIARVVPGVADLEDALFTAIASGRVPRSALVVANDWTALPAALRAYKRFGMPFYYDSHEFALQEHASNGAWRLTFPPMIERIEGEGLRKAYLATCVGAGIASAMQAHYELAVSPVVIRNLPTGVPLAPRPPVAPFQVLYHGLFKPDRGLEALIRSVQHWPAEFRLVLRGRAPSSSYQAGLEALAAGIGGGGRIVIEPMVSQEAVIAKANASDIGTLVFDTRFDQNRLALPNKLFEYLHAGLVPIVAAGTEAATLISRAGIGTQVDPGDDGAIPRFLAGLDASRLFAAKQAAHQAAKVLTWERDARTLQALIPPPR